MYFTNKIIEESYSKRISFEQDSFFVLFDKNLCNTTGYSENNINIDSLSHMESTGLIRIIDPLNVIIDPYQKKCAEHFKMTYSNQTFEFKKNKSKMTGSNEIDYNVCIGLVKLTRLGEELFPICGSNPVDGFKEYTLEQWKNAAPHYIIRDL